MSSRIKSGLMGGLGLGVATAAMGYFMTPMMELSEAEQIANIEACAQHLGDEVTPIEGDLPDDCDIYTYSIGDYFYPTRSEFVEDKMATVSTDEDIAEQSKKMGLALGTLGFALGGLTLGTAARPPKEQETN